MRRISFLVLAAAAVGCSALLHNIDDVNEPKDDVSLARCRKEARDKLYVGATQEEKEAAYELYVECTKDAGLR